MKTENKYSLFKNSNIMKAKLYISGALMQVRVSNKSYDSVDNEKKADFLKRVEKELEKDFDEFIEIAEVKIETLKKLDNEMLAEAYRSSKGLQEKILLDILTERGVEVEKIEKPSRKRVEPMTKEQMQATEEYKAAKANVGKLAQYFPKDSEEIIKGVVKSLSLNKTNTIIYYNIQQGTKLRCATAKNETLQFFDF